MEGFYSSKVPVSIGKTPSHKTSTNKLHTLWVQKFQSPQTIVSATKTCIVHLGDQWHHSWGVFIHWRICVLPILTTSLYISCCIHKHTHSNLHVQLSKSCIQVKLTRILTCVIILYGSVKLNGTIWALCCATELHYHKLKCHCLALSFRLDYVRDAAIAVT